jgi:hypothetical protein
MATTSAADAPHTEQVVNLRNPVLAAFLGWLVPGAGHLYQGRTGKGLLYMICILGTFFYGLYLGNGKVVYFSWRPNDTRWAYFCQVGVGLAALPALIQADRARNDRAPLFDLDIMTPPKSADAWRKSENDDLRKAREQPDSAADLRKYESPEELAWWNKSLHRYFELGTVYTMIAGLLNVLAMYDAFAGPVPVEVSDEDDENDK